MYKTIAILIAAFVLLGALCAQAETIDELKAKMDKFADSFHGTLGYSLHFLGKPDDRISRNGDEPFPTASTIKTSIMCEVMHQIEQGKIKWTDQVAVQSDDDREDGGFASYFRDGTKISVGEWVHLMITVSDNTATIRLREFVGQKNVNDWLTANGFKTTKLLNGSQCDELGLRQLQRRYGLGMTSPNEMERLVEMIRTNKAGSRASCERMMRLLSHQYWDDYIGSQVPPMHVASKSGFIGGTRADVAVVSSPKGDYVLSIYIKNCADENWGINNEGDRAVRTIAAMVWQHYDPKNTYSPPQGFEKLLPSE